MKAYQLVKNISQDTNKNSHQELIVKSTCRKYLLKSSMWMTNKGLLFSSNFDFTTRHSSWFSLTHIIFYFSPRVSYSMSTNFDLWMWDYPFIAQYLPASWSLFTDMTWLQSFHCENWTRSLPLLFIRWWHTSIPCKGIY